MPTKIENIKLLACDSKKSVTKKCKKVRGHCIDATAECGEGEEKMEGKGCRSSSCACCYTPCKDEGCEEAGGMIENSSKKCTKQGKESDSTLASGHEGCTCCLDPPQ